MNKPKSFYKSHPVVIIFIGLIIAQAIATIQVYLSNLDLYNTITQVASAGYLAIPNRHAMGNLQELSTAFWGGLFFTATIGAGIALVALVAAWIWVHLFLQKKAILFFFGFVWAGLSFLVNRNGFSLMPTLYFLFVAPVVFTLTAKRESMSNSQSDQIRQWIHLIPVPLLALLWFTQFDNSMFLDLRDNLLLSNKYGRNLSKFYYTYTLYPAEAFKALNQKSIKTSRINTAQARLMNQRIARRLIANDYIPLSNATQVDLTILQNNDYLILQTDNHHAFQIPITQFFDDTRNVLLRISEESDRHAVFRQFTFLSLLIGFPVSLYMIMHAVFYYPGRFIMGRNNAAMTASIICLLIGIAVLLFFQSNRSRSIQIQNISDSLSSNHWQTRVAALKLIAQKKLDIARYRSYPLRQSNLPPQERYWLVRTLAFSRRPENFMVLLEYLNDDNLNVRTMALYSLGLRGNRQAIQPIISRIKNSKKWYEQMYAYKALRSLGWKQTKSH
jgi:hypothetical protein